MYIRLHVESTRYSCHMLMKHAFCQQIFAKYSTIKLYENQSTGIRVISYGQTGMTQLVVTYRSFAKAPKHMFRMREAGAFSLSGCESHSDTGLY